MKKLLPVAFNALLTLCIIFTAIVFSIELYTYNDAFFEKQYKSYNAAHTIGTDMPSLMRVTDKLQGYLRGSEPSLDVEVLREGETVQFFNEREKDHMVDVLVLFNFARIIKYASIAIVALYVLLCAFCKLFPFGRRFCKMYINIVSAVVIIGVMLTLIISINFDKAWTFVHTLVFSNDLWLLNPSTDMLINLVPLEFFIAITSRIGIAVALQLAAVYALCAVYLVRTKKRMAVQEVRNNELSRAD